MQLAVDYTYGCNWARGGGFWTHVFSFNQNIVPTMVLWYRDEVIVIAWFFLLVFYAGFCCTFLDYVTHFVAHQVLGANKSIKSVTYSDTNLS
jgi:hypothetical protein